jgi:hypothetical protein
MTPPHDATPAPEPIATAAPGEIQWEIAVPLLTNPIMLGTFAKLFLITGLIMGLLLSGIMLAVDEAESIGPLLLMTLGLTAGLAVLSGLVSLVVFGNRMHMAFRLDADGAQARVIDKRAGRANKIAVVAGVLAGKPGVTGAGLLAQSGSSQSARWSAIAKARYHPGSRTVSLSNSWRTVINLFCTAENYDAVAAAVRTALAGRVGKMGPASKARRNPLPMLLLRTVLTVLACAPLFGMPFLEEKALLPAILTVCFALAAVWLVPPMAWAALAGVAWVFGLELLACLETRASLFGSGSFKAYEVLSGDDWFVIALAGAGAAYLAWISAGLLTGRLRSGLAGDRMEMEGE